MSKTGTTRKGKLRVLQLFDKVDLGVGLFIEINDNQYTKLYMSDTSSARKVDAPALRSPRGFIEPSNMRYDELSGLM